MGKTGSLDGCWTLTYRPTMAAGSGPLQPVAMPKPWFRIFNPITQSERFDPQGKFIRRYVPELATVPDKYIHAPWTMPAEPRPTAGRYIGRDYPTPIVDHAEARQRTLARFKAATGEATDVKKPG